MKIHHKLNLLFMIISLILEENHQQKNHLNNKNICLTLTGKIHRLINYKMY